MSNDGWRPIRKPDGADRSVTGAFEVTPFARLTRVHGAAAASDAAVAVALAGSIFFSISPNDARWRVALYLLLTAAPFAIVTPLIGPAIDRVRGGRRVMLLVTTIGRMILAFFLISYIESLLLFPIAFGFLVMQKGYSVARSAVVPRLVGDETELVDANARLALISALLGVAGAMVGGFFSLIGGSGWSAGVAAVGFAVATGLLLKLPPVTVASEPMDAEERAELRSSRVVLAASAMAVVRGVVGFVTFLLAFEFRGGEDGLDVSEPGAAMGGATATARNVDIVGDPAAPAWHFGVVIAGAAAGALAGAKLAPRMRKQFSEESMLSAVLVSLMVAGLLAAWSGGLFGATLLSLAVGTSAATAKLAFDSLVQREAPDANYGRTFARFEARFQIAWVIGAFIPAVLPLSGAFGAAMVAAAALFAFVSYFFGSRHDESEGPSDDDSGELSDDDLRPSQPSAPAGTGDVLARIDDPTTVLGAGAGVDPTRQIDTTTSIEAGTSTDGDAAESGGEGDPAAAWWSDPSAPIVSSVEGLEVDDDD